MTGYPIPDDVIPPCAAEPDLFFAPNGVREDEAAREERTTAARAICSSCPWLQACLEYALRYSVEGLWAGTDEEERQAIRERRGIVPEHLGSGKGARGWGPEPHGTPARYRKHRRDGEPACLVCTEGLRLYQERNRLAKGGNRSLNTEQVCENVGGPEGASTPPGPGTTPSDVTGREAPVASIVPPVPTGKTDERDAAHNAVAVASLAFTHAVRDGHACGLTVAEMADASGHDAGLIARLLGEDDL